MVKWRAFPPLRNSQGFNSPNHQSKPPVQTTNSVVQECSHLFARQTLSMLLTLADCPVGLAVFNLSSKQQRLEATDGRAQCSQDGNPGKGGSRVRFLSGWPVFRAPSWCFGIPSKGKPTRVV